MNELKVNKTQELEIYPNNIIIKNENNIPNIFKKIINYIYEISSLLNQSYIIPNDLLEQLTLKNSLFENISDDIINQLYIIKCEIAKMIKNKDINQINNNSNNDNNILIKINRNVFDKSFTNQINFNLNYINLHKNINIINGSFIGNITMNEDDSITPILSYNNNFEQRKKRIIRFVYSLSNGNIIVISSPFFSYLRYASLYTYKNNNFIELDYLHILSYPPNIIYELKNKTILFTGMDHIAFYKIKKNKIYRSSYHHTDHNGHLINEIIQIKELENNKIILLNKKGNIYIVEKITKLKKQYIKCLPNGSLEIDGQVIDGIPEYIFTGVIRNDDIENNWLPKCYVYRMYYRMIFEKNNVIYFSNVYYRAEFNIDFSNENYKINKNQIFTRYMKGIQNFSLEFDDEFVFCLYNDVDFCIINKNTIELVAFYQMDKIINHIIKIEKNYYLCSFTNYDIGLIDFRDKDLNIKIIKILDMKVFLTKSKEQILLISDY